MDEEEPERRKLVIFGRDVAKIPCFRKTFIFGISSGIVGGLAYFMFTSNVRRACHAGILTFGATSIAYWMQCRYFYAINKFNVGQIPGDAFKDA